MSELRGIFNPKYGEPRKLTKKHYITLSALIFISGLIGYAFKEALLKQSIQLEIYDYQMRFIAKGNKIKLYYRLQPYEEKVVYYYVKSLTVIPIKIHVKSNSYIEYQISDILYPQTFYILTIKIVNPEKTLKKVVITIQGEKT